MQHRNGYSGTQIALHWIIAILILFNYIYSDGMGRALRARIEGSPATELELNPGIHVWVGVAVLVLTLIRLALRETRGVPEAGGTGAMQQAAIWGHRLLYLLMIVVPLLGGLTWFGKVDGTGDPHGVLANLLMIVAGGHAVMAIYHQYFLRDGLMKRMMRADES